VRACWAAGVTTVADTGDSGAVVEALAELGGSGVVYHEVFGPIRQLEQNFAGWSPGCASSPPRHRRVRLGVSPTRRTR